MYGCQTIDADTLAETLDALAAAVFVVDRAGVILHASRSARRVFATVTAASPLGHRLRLPEARADALLRRAVARAEFGDLDGGDAIAFRCCAGKGFVATAAPLPGAAERDGAGPCAVVSVQETAFEPPASVEPLAHLHALTRRELTVLTASVELGDVALAAASLGVSHHTLRSHLRSIYQKTGASRQADLVKLVAGVTGPFGGKTRARRHGEALRRGSGDVAGRPFP